MTAADSTDVPAGRASTTRLRGRRRRWVVALVALVACIAVLALVDRIALAVTERRLAGRIQTSQQLTSRPNVTIGGYPFLLQALRGRYRHVDITATSPITRNAVTLATAHVRLDGVRVRISDVARGTVRNVPVQAGTGTALVTYSALTALVHRYGGPAATTITVTSGGAGRARLTGPLGLSLDVTGAIVGGGVRITPDPGELGTLPGFIRSGITQALSTPIPLPALPFGVTLTSGEFQPAGLILHASAHDSIFPVR